MEQNTNPQFTQVPVTNGPAPNVPAPPPRGTNKLPMWAKIFIGVLVLAAIGKIVDMHERRPVYHSNYSNDADGAISRQDVSNSESTRQASSSGGEGQRLAQLQSQQAQVVSQMTACKTQLEQASQQAAAAAMQGQFYNGQPQCQSYMPLWIAQEAVLETNIYRIQTGNYNATVLEVSGVQVGPEYSRSLVSSSRGSSDDGTGAVEDWDRGAIRGTQMYRDESGQEQELANHNFYYRNRSTGELVPTQLQNPPDNQHDWELLQPVAHNQ
jgi:hypothetical protein